MTETLLSLVPTYGLWLIFASVFLSCLALPVPSSVLVLAAGGFAAAGDLVLWQVIASALAGFVAGDQTAFQIGRLGGAPLLDRLSSHARLGKPLSKARAMLDQRGASAVFLSRTVLSPVGPYVGILGAALGLRWLAFVTGALPGAATWATTYSLLGYTATDRLAQSASLLGWLLGALVALALSIWAINRLRKGWAAYQRARNAERAP